MNKELVDNLSKQYILVRLNNEQYGIDIQKVQNIIRIRQITRVPNGPNFIKGIINLRGEIIPVMSLRIKFNLEPKEYTNDTRIIIIKTDEYEVGVIVDEVKEVLQISSNNIEEVQGLSTEINSSFIQGVGKIENDIVTLLDIDGLILFDEKNNQAF